MKMKKTIAILLVLTLLLSFAACTKEPVKPKTSMELYEAFLDGEELVYGGMPFAWDRYDSKGDAYVAVLGKDEGVTILELIGKMNDSFDLSGLDTCFESVEYAYIDCGNDGEPELALRFVYPENTTGGENQFVIKNIDGTLRLCKHAESYYRYIDSLFNVYGMFEFGGSTGAGCMVYGQDFVNADGEYKYLYSTDYYWEMDWCYPFEEEFRKAAEELEVEVPVNAEIALTTFVDYRTVGDDEYYDGMLVSVTATEDEDLRIAKMILDKAGISYVEESEVDAAINAKKAELGIGDEVYNNHDYVEWIPLETQAIYELCAYGPNPVYVSNADEFANAIRDDAVIVLAPGEYNLTSWLVEKGRKGDVSVWTYADNYGNPEGVLASDASFDADETGFIINGVNNLKIVAEDSSKETVILSQPRTEDVIHFTQCSNVIISDVTIGHTPDAGLCDGDVLGFYYCNGVKVKKCDLYGCGAYGIDGWQSDNVEITGSRIHNCTYGCAMLVGCDYVYFENTVFENCTGFTMFNVNESGSVCFDDCTFRNIGNDILYCDAEANVFLYANNVYDPDSLDGFRNHGGEGAVNMY